MAADPEALFLQHLTTVDRATHAVARRHGFMPDEIADLAAWVRLRIIEDDYAPLRKFRGESSFSTYLTVVVAMLVRDYGIQRRGRWRPSMAARRLGDVAVRLEHLVFRSGCSLQHAGEQLRTSGVTTQSDADLAAVLAMLPARQPLRPVEVGADGLGVVPAASTPQSDVESVEADAQRHRAREALVRALDGLPAEDRLIVQLRFWEALSVAEIARGLRLEQKGLYRRLERILATLRASLARAGLDGRQVQDLLDDPAP